MQSGNEKDAEQFFKDSSTWLLHDCVLIIGSKEHRIREIEMYFTSEQHQDPFTHCHPLQSTSMNWYFHRMNNSPNASYKGGSFKGLDITIGNKNKNFAGGILIRSLEEIQTKKIICGPSLCVDYILNTNSCDSVDSFVKTKLNDNLDATCNMQSYLFLKDTTGVPRKEARKKIIFTARIGLYFTKKDVSLEKQQQFIFKLYRAVSDHFQISKGKVLAIVALLEKGTSVSEIMQLTGCTHKMVSKYTCWFYDGQNMNPNSFIGNKWTEAQLCTCYASVTKKFPNFTNSNIVEKQSFIPIDYPPEPEPIYTQTNSVPSVTTNHLEELFACARKALIENEPKVETKPKKPKIKSYEKETPKNDIIIIEEIVKNSSNRGVKRNKFGALSNY